jgi:hypothetical protein
MIDYMKLKILINDWLHEIKNFDKFDYMKLKTLINERLY